MKKKRKQEMRRFILRSSATGFIGGVMLGLSWIVLYYFNFVEFDLRTIVLNPWITSEWSTSWEGSGISIVGIGIFSIVIALFYYLLFKQINSIWMGIAYGILVWILIFLFIGLLFSDLKITRLESETIISTLSIFVLYGTFIGYSISYDWYRTQQDRMLDEDV